MWSVYEGRGYVNLLLAGVCGLASCSTFHLNAFSCTKNNVARHIDPEAFNSWVKAVVAFRRTWFVPRQCDIMSYELAKHTCHVSEQSRFWGLLCRIRWWCILGKQLSADGSCVWELIHINLEGKRRKTCYIACRTGFVVQKLRGTLIAATILKAIKKLIRQDSLSVSMFKTGGRTLLLSLFALQNAPVLQTWEAMHLKIYEISLSQNVNFLWGTKVYKLGFPMIFGLVNVIWFTAIVCLFSYIFFQGEWFCWSKLWTNFEGSEKNLGWGNGIQCNISLNAWRSSLIVPSGHKTITVNTISHDVLIWVQGRNIFFIANRTQPQDLITQKCSCYGQADL